MDFWFGSKRELILAIKSSQLPHTPPTPPPPHLPSRIPAAIASSINHPEPIPMSVDLATVKRVAHLARIAVTDEEAAKMEGELNAILGFVEQLNEVDIDGVEPMTSVTPMQMKKRQDVVTDGDKAADIVANAPLSDENFFLVPKVVE